MMKNLLINLPEDVFINNILLSKILPVKSLLSLRCVCTYLRNLITSPAFINMQISKELINNNNNNNNNPLVLINATTHRSDVFFSLKFNGDHDPCRPEVVEIVSPIEHPKIWGSCNGLVCLRKRPVNVTVCLWNPFTKEYKILPPPLLPSTEIPIGGISGSITYGFGYDRLLGDYKIIRCSEHFVRRSNVNSNLISITEFQIYTLGTNTWRKISNSTTDNNPYFVDSLPSSVVFVNGAFHWIMSTSNWWLLEKSSQWAEAKIVSFDIEKEVFQEIQKPSMAKFKLELFFCPVIHVLRDCLCVLELDYNTQTFCDVWMMMDYGVKGSWTKLLTIVSKEVSEMLPGASYKLLRFCGNGSEILMASYCKISVYDSINNKARHVEFGEEFGKGMYQSGIYIESLASLNSGVYMDERRIRSKKKGVSKC